MIDFSHEPKNLFNTIGNEYVRVKNKLSIDDSIDNKTIKIEQIAKNKHSQIKLENNKKEEIYNFFINETPKKTLKINTFNTIENTGSGYSDSKNSDKIKVVDQDFQANEVTYETKKTYIFDSERNKINQIYSSENKRYNTDCNYIDKNYETKNITNIEFLSKKPNNNNLNFEENLFDKIEKKNQKLCSEFEINVNTNNIIIENNNNNNNLENNQNNGHDSRR